MTQTTIAMISKTDSRKLKTLIRRLCKNKENHTLYSLSPVRNCVRDIGEALLKGIDKTPEIRCEIIKDLTEEFADNMDCKWRIQERLGVIRIASTMSDPWKPFDPLYGIIPDSDDVAYYEDLSNEILSILNRYDTWVMDYSDLEFVECYYRIIIRWNGHQINVVDWLLDHINETSKSNPEIMEMIQTWRESERLKLSMNIK